MRKGGFEPPRLAAPPPQDGVSANSTTSALEPTTYRLPTRVPIVCQVFVESLSFYSTYPTPNSDKFSMHRILHRLLTSLNYVYTGKARRSSPSTELGLEGSSWERHDTSEA